MKASEVESLSFRKEKPAEEEAEGPVTHPRYLWGLFYLYIYIYIYI